MPEVLETMSVYSDSKLEVSYILKCGFLGEKKNHQGISSEGYGLWLKFMAFNIF